MRERKHKNYRYKIDFLNAEPIDRGDSRYASVPVYLHGEYVENRTYTRIELTSFFNRRKETGTSTAEVAAALKKIFNIDVE